MLAVAVSDVEIDNEYQFERRKFGGNPSNATHAQSSCECCSQDQRKHVRDRISPFSPALGPQSSHRSDSSSTVSTDLADSASRSSLPGTRTGGHQTLQATAHLANDSATPEPRLLHRTPDSSTLAITGVIFDPGVLPALFCVDGPQGNLLVILNYPSRKCGLPASPTRQRPPRRRLCSHGQPFNNPTYQSWPTTFCAGYTGRGTLPRVAPSK
jgi:hypothetical protein